VAGNDGQNKDHEKSTINKNIHIKPKFYMFVLSLCVLNIGGTLQNIASN
jgi:hypothetical protein